MNNLQVAIVGELKGKGGAERVMLELTKEFNADVYSMPYSKSFQDFGKFDIYKASLISEKIPIPTRSLEILISDLEKKMKTVTLDLSDYDLVIVGKSVGMFAAIDHHPNLYYCHGTPSYIFQHKQFYEKRYGSVFSIWSDFWSTVFKNLSDYIDQWIVNSKTTQETVKKVYGKDSKVVYPPVNIQNFEEGESEGYFLSVQNLSPAKRVDWQIKAFNELDEELRIVGTGPEREKLESMAKDNIVFEGNVSDSELVELYSHCEAVIQTNPFEDFGIVPIEGMASGKPAICPNNAGFTETINDKTGILFNQPYPKELRNAVMNFDSDSFDSQDCVERSKKFGRGKFRSKMRVILEESI